MMFSLSERLGEARNKGELHRQLQHEKVYSARVFSLSV